MAVTSLCLSSTRASSVLALRFSKFSNIHRNIVSVFIKVAVFINGVFKLVPFFFRKFVYVYFIFLKLCGNPVVPKNMHFDVLQSLNSCHEIFDLIYFQKRKM